MDTSWREYQRIFWSFELSLLQNEIISFYVSHLLANFPNKLPTHIKKKFTQSIADWKKAVRIIEEFREKGGDLKILQAFSKEIAREQNQKKTKKKSRKVDHKKGIDKFFNLAVAAVNSGEKNPKDFPGIFRSQELVMLLAHFEAFLSDSLRTIYFCKPEKLRRSKTIEWKEIIEFESMDALREHLTNKAVYEFGWLTLEKKLSLLQEDHGIEIRLSASEVKFLRDSEGSRHLVVHSGGRQHITGSEIKENTVNWTAQKNERLIRIMRKVAKKMHSEIGRKFYNVSRKEATVKL